MSLPGDLISHKELLCRPFRAIHSTEQSTTGRLDFTKTLSKSELEVRCDRDGTCVAPAHVFETLIPLLLVMWEPSGIEDFITVG